MFPDPNPTPEINEEEAVTQWREYIGAPFPSDYTIKFELQQRIHLHFRGEENTRAGRHQEFAEYRVKNATRLFEILRTADLHAARLLVDVNHLECRLLRLIGRFDECRQLCQSMPVYVWDYATLQEYIWATKGDDYPHKRFQVFKDREDRDMVHRFVQSARESFQEDLASWKARRDGETNPPPPTKVQGVLQFVTLGVPLMTAYVLYEPFGLIAAAGIYLAGIFVMLLLLSPFTSKIRTKDDLVKEWEKMNPRPVCRISDKPDTVL